MRARAFHVGQLVRVVYAPAAPEIVGEVTRVLRVEVNLEYGVVYVVPIPCVPGDRESFGPAMCFAPVYDGDEPASWSDCVWQPQREVLDA
jgi:hypothetical protein